MGSNNLEVIKNNIRATLTGNKKGITEEELSKQYHENCHTRIPYQDFGFARLSDFLNTLGDIIRIFEVDNEYYYTEIPKKETQHISKLVQSQGKGKNSRFPSKKEKKVQKANVRRLPSEEITWIKKILFRFPMGIDIDTFNKQYMEYSGSTLCYEKYGFSDLVECLSSLSYLLSVKTKNKTQYIYALKSLIEEKDAGSKVVQNPIPQHVLFNLEQLIMDKPQGMDIHNLLENYKNKYKEKLNFERYGYSNLSEMIRSLSYTFKMESFGSSWVVHYLDPKKNSYNLKEVNENLKKIMDEERVIGILTTDIFDYYQARYSMPLDPLSLGYQNMDSMLMELCGFEKPYFFMEEIAGAKYILKALSKSSPPKKNTFDIEELEFPKEINGSVDIIVDEIDNPWNFYVRLRKYSNALINLMESLDAYCKLKRSSLIMDFGEIHPGDYVAAYYLDTDQWHRAEVIEVRSHNHISICYIDFGTLDKNIRIDKILRLEPRFYDLPKQAIRVKLANIWRLNSKNSVFEAGQIMSKYVIDKELIGKLMSFSSDKVPEILIMDVSSNKSTGVIFVNEMLVKKGLASDKPIKNDGKQKEGLRRPLRSTQDLFTQKTTTQLLNLSDDRSIHLIPGTEFRLIGDLEDLLVASPEISNLFPKWKGKDILTSFLEHKKIKFSNHTLNQTELQIYRSLISNTTTTNKNKNSLERYSNDAVNNPVTMFLLRDVPHMISIFAEPESDMINIINIALREYSLC